MSMTIGRKIKHLRKKKGLTQQQLAKDICTQALISMFESEETIPSSVVLYKMAERLEVDINYFFDDFTPSVQFYTKGKNIFSVIRKLITTREFHNAHMIINHELEKKKHLTDYELAFYYWHKGICEWVLNQNYELAFQLYEQALQLAVDYEELVISIKNSIAILYYHNERCNDAILIYEECIAILENVAPKDTTLYRRILFGLAKAYTFAGRYDEAIATCDKGIAIAINEESLYSLDRFLFRKAIIHSKNNQIEQAIQLYSQAKVLFQLLGNQDYVQRCDNNINKLQLQLQLQ